MHHLQRVTGEARGVLAHFAVAFSMMEGMSTDAEDGRFSSEEEGEHKVENFMLCSLAHLACSLLWQGFLHEEEGAERWNLSHKFELLAEFGGEFSDECRSVRFASAVRGTAAWF